MELFILIAIGAVVSFYLLIFIVAAVTWKYLHPVIKSYFWWFIRFFFWAPIAVSLVAFFEVISEENIILMITGLIILNIIEAFWIPLRYVIIATTNDDRHTRNLPPCAGLWDCIKWQFEKA